MDRPLDKRCLHVHKFAERSVRWLLDTFQSVLERQTFVVLLLLPREVMKHSKLFRLPREALRDPLLASPRSAMEACQEWPSLTR
jgi:hypothetical protein